MSVATICKPGSLVVSPASLPTGAGVPYLQNPTEQILITGSNQTAVSSSINQIVADGTQGTIITGNDSVSLLSSSGQVFVGTAFNSQAIISSTDNQGLSVAAAHNITLTSYNQNITINAGSIEIPGDAQVSIGTSNAIEVDTRSNVLLLVNSEGQFSVDNKTSRGRIYDSFFNKPPVPPTLQLTNQGLVGPTTAAATSLNADFLGKVNYVSVGTGLTDLLLAPIDSQTIFTPTTGNVVGVFFTALAINNFNISQPNVAPSPPTIPVLSFTNTAGNRPKLNWIYWFICISPGSWQPVNVAYD